MQRASCLKQGQVVKYFWEQVITISGFAKEMGANGPREAILSKPKEKEKCGLSIEPGAIVLLP